MSDVDGRARSLRSAVARLTATNVLVSAFAFVTSPLLARFLGPVGRGEVAAIQAVVGLAPWVTELGLNTFFTVQASRKERGAGELLGTLSPMIVIGALIAAALSQPIAHVFSHGRPEVARWIEIGLIALPITAVFGGFQSFAFADERWTLINLTRVLSPVGATVGIVALALFNDVTVASVSITYMVSGAIAVIPLITAVPPTRRLVFRAGLAFEGLKYGLRSWLATVASVANFQLDQLLIAATLASRELGWYALAATLANASLLLVSAVQNVITPRAAVKLDPDLLARACRLSLLLVAAFGLVGAVAGIEAVPIIFGDDFRPAIRMLQILLLASVIYAPGQVIGAAFLAGGRPGTVTVAQFCGLGVTVPGLVLLLPRIGAIGAAWASLAGYGAVTIVLLIAAARVYGLRWLIRLAPRTADLLWLFTTVKGLRRSEDAAGTAP